MRKKKIKLSSQLKRLEQPERTLVKKILARWKFNRAYAEARARARGVGKYE